MQAQISLVIDRQPGSLHRVVSTLRRFGLTVDDANVHANRVLDGYSLNVKVDTEEVSPKTLESELKSLRGVTDVINISARPRTISHDLRRRRVADATERDRRKAAAERVNAVVRAYPLILPKVRAYEGMVAGSGSAVELMRNFGVRCGRLIAAGERRFEGIESLDHAFDQVLVGFLFPIARLKIDGYNLRITESVFTDKDTGDGTSQSRPGKNPCVFLEGLIEGMLNHAPGLPAVRVEETRCRASGHRECRFHVEPVSERDEQ